MSKSVAVVYWSGTGNTETMANTFADAASAAGANVSTFSVSEFSADEVESFDAFAFGCPAMGAEELEADEFEPVWDECKDALGDKPVVLFGSYGWGVGEWMDTWKDAAEGDGVNVVATAIANYEPDDEANEALEAAAQALVEA